MDPVDRRIVLALRRNARISYRDLAALVGLSANAAADRVRRLERAGVLRGYTAIVDPAQAGRNLMALIDVRLRPNTPPERFEPYATGLDLVLEAVHLTGAYDYQLKVSVTDTAELDKLIRLLKARAEVTETATRIVLRTVVDRAGSAIGDSED